MLKRDSAKSNFIFQMLYQTIILIIPLIVAPYLTRHLGDTALGIYNYSYSIAYYFVVFAMLGIQRHGQRVIASCRTDEVKLRKTFWSLFIVHCIFSILSVICYISFVFLFVHEDKDIFLIQTLYVFSALFDITWLFYGIEKFKSVVIKNALIKVVELILIVLFVKNSSDLKTYTFIMSGSILAGFAVLIPQAIKYIKPVSVTYNDMREHIKPLFILSVSVIAVTIYTMFDKTLLGLLISKESVAHYEYSNKIVSIPKSFIAVIGTVLFPRACGAFAKDDFQGVKKYFKYALLVTYGIGFPATMGIIAVANPFSVLYFGEGFAICGNYMKVLSPVILIIGLGDIIRTQFLIPSKQDIKYVVCLVINSILNLSLNLILIPKCGVYGAIIGTLAAETIGLCIQTYICKKWIDFKQAFVLAIPFALSSIIMYVAIKFIQRNLTNSWKSLLIQIFAGAIIYFVLVGIWFVFVSREKGLIRNKLKTQLQHPFLKGMVRNDVKAKRDPAIDLMRILGMILIVLSHTSVGKTFPLLQNICDFDVPLMVFISGIAFSLSNYNFETWKDYLKYVYKRFKRLVIPCWIFVSLYLLFTKVIGIFIPNNICTVNTILTSYSLISGFGYVWIIRIFLCMAVLAPFMAFLSRYAFVKKYYSIIYLFLLFIEYSVIRVNSFLPKPISGVMNVLIIPIIGYAIVYLTSIVFTRLSRKTKGFLILSNFALVVIETLLHGFEVGAQKYPPNILYLSYGVLVSIVLYLLLTKISFSTKTTIWLSKNAFTIYFVHVFIVFFFENINHSFNWVSEYVVLLLGSLICCIVLDFTKKILWKKHDNKTAELIEKKGDK